MHSLVHSRTAASTTGTVGLGRIVRALRRALRRNRGRRQLMALDDRMLADIGISRADILRLDLPDDDL